MSDIATSTNLLDNAVFRDTLLQLNDESTCGLAMILLDGVDGSHGSQGRGCEDSGGDSGCEEVHGKLYDVVSFEGLLEELKNSANRSLHLYLGYSG